MLPKPLQYLAALAHERHFARAAAACNVTQPTLSAGIKQLEEELGLLLVQRGQRFEGLTPEGEKILHWATRILADHEGLVQQAAELREGLVGRLRIGVIPTALPMTAMLTEPFLAAHPQVAVTVLPQSSREIQRGLDDFSLDAGVTYLDNEPLSGVRQVPLYREHYYLFTPRSDPLAERSTVSWEDVAGLRLCLLTPDMQNRRIIDAHFNAVNILVHPALETSSVLTIWAHLQQGTWSTVLPQTFLHQLELPPAVAAVPLNESTPGFTIGVVIPDREPLTPSARELAVIAAEAKIEQRLPTLR